MLAASVICLPAQQQKAAVALNPSKMAKLAAVDPRYVSYNIEMVEVTGGRFWKPYNSASQPAAPQKATDANQQVGEDQNRFQYRPPINLSNPKLRNLAKALGPSYVRVSGTWANSTYFQNDDQAALKEPPKGFRGVLTRAEWKGVLDFAKETDAQLVTSVAISPGTRDANGVWTPAQAKELIDYTKTTGGKIAATEFMNEPTIPEPGGAPAGYDAAAFARDAKIFDAFLRKESPQTIFLGPGGVGEGSSLLSAGLNMKLIKTEDILKSTEPIFDAFSYHFYGAVSRRCNGKTTVDEAMSAEWLNRTDAAESFYAGLRDKYMPGKPLWLTENAEAACGGDPLAAQFVDTFRYLNQLGTLAQKGVKVVMHNTLAASDYGLLDENTLDPRPDFWAALLWKRNMGNVVLDPGSSANPSLRIYAQCSTAGHGAVTLLALNTDTQHPQTLTTSDSAERFTLTASGLESTNVLLNGKQLNAENDGSMPALKPERVKSGSINLPPASATFLVIRNAHNDTCR